MSKRWFILVISILFLFAFRVWIDDVSPFHVKNMANTDDQVNMSANNGYRAYIFPVSQPSTIYHSAQYSDYTPFYSKDLFSSAALTDSGILYIFPTWPEGLDVNLEEVVVDNFNKINAYPDLEFQGH